MQLFPQLSHSFHDSDISSKYNIKTTIHYTPDSLVFAAGNKTLSFSGMVFMILYGKALHDLCENKKR